jgi:Arc/MetJ-type ribon-helix-helix transcriptional regulator
MAKKTHIRVGDHFKDGINAKLKMEEEKQRKAALINELKTGEKADFIQSFDRKKFIEELHTRYLS